MLAGPIPVSNVPKVGRFESRGALALPGLLFFLAGGISRFATSRPAIGAGWAVIQPLATMTIFTLIFGKLAKCLPTGWPIPSSPSQVFCPGPIFLKRSLGVRRVWWAVRVSSAKYISHAYRPPLCGNSAAG